MKFIAWTLLLSAVAIFMFAVLVGVLTGHKYQLNADSDNPRNQGRSDMTIDRENTGVILFIGVLGIAFSGGALRNWRSILWSKNSARN
jgi:hypothetical protein